MFETDALYSVQHMKLLSAKQVTVNVERRDMTVKEMSKNDHLTHSTYPFIKAAVFR